MAELQNGLINVSELIAADTDKKHNYARKRNTSALIQKIVSSLHIQGLTGEELWDLVSLTWVTKSEGAVSVDSWKIYKIPALARFYEKVDSDVPDLKRSIAAMGLPESVADAAIRETGIVNFYNAYRNSAKPWCESNAASLRSLILNASRFENDQGRLELAEKIEKLPGIPLPHSTKAVLASEMLTPLIACIDRQTRFPVINGRKEVRRLLRGMQLAPLGLRTQVKGLMGLIDRFGISDAHMIDVCADELAEQGKEFLNPQPEWPKNPEGRSLEEYDESERIAVQNSATVHYRSRHNQMTNALRLLFAELNPEEGRMSNKRYDIMLKNYDGAGRNLLIEVKPDPDKGSMRMAIGQLYDYRRSLNDSAGTDLAVLNIGRPDQSYMDLIVLDRGITALWFDEGNFQTLSGDGNAWKSLEAALHSDKITPTQDEHTLISTP